MTYFDRNNIKGKYGEDLVKSYLNQKGFMVYSPQTDAPHCVDFVVHKVGKKHDWYLCEVKTKPIKPPYNTTGMNKSHFEDYLAMYEGDHNLDTWVFFVDEIEGTCYGNRISKMKDCIHKTIVDSRNGKEIVIWTRQTFTTVFKLTKPQTDYLKTI